MTYWREKAVSQNILVGHSPMKDEKISKVNKRTLNYYFKKIFFLNFKSLNSKIKKYNHWIFKYLGKQNLIMKKEPNGVWVRLG